MEWIKCSDRMPEITRISDEWRCSDDVLCKSDRFGFFVARWSEFEGDRNNFWNPTGIQGNGLIRPTAETTHWTYIDPIPEALI